MRILSGLLALTLTVCTAPAATPPAPGASATSTSAIALPTPSPLEQLFWRLDVPRSTDRYFVSVAPSGREAVAADLDAQSFAFFNLRGDQNGWSDARGLDLVWWTWLSDSSGLLGAIRTSVDGRPTTQLVVFGHDRGDLKVIGEEPSGPDEPRLSPDGQWLAFGTKCCPRRIIATRLDGSDRRELATSPSIVSLLGWDARSRVMYADSRDLYWVGLDGRASDSAAIDLGLPAGVNAVGVRILDQSPDRSGAFIGMFADRAFPGAGSNNYGIRRLVGDRFSEFTSQWQIVGWLNDHEFIDARRPPVAVDIVTGFARSLGVSDDQQQPTALSGRILLSQGNSTEMYVLRLGVDDHYRSLDVPGNLRCCPGSIGDGLFLFRGVDGWMYVVNGEVAARS
ncbi:MAG TPA: hypothetical protein VEN31_07360 [Candidatus Bathyarchaeia archaeon]|nr:hypothetical protein [Candidatus Bathyarchaeia archaeon]